MDRVILITGGAGFVGSSLAVSLKRSHPEWRLVCLDNLRRRGSELNLPRLREAGVRFIHGDIRIREDLPFQEHLDTILECSADPSVLSGSDSSPDYVLGANLVGTLNCLELARRSGADLIFLSTSRVYPIRKLNALRVQETDSRFSLLPDQPFPGASAAGISTDFPLDGYRSLYGATKLASELIIAEYNELYKIRAIVNRCGVIAGPWQMGRIDQGVFAMWVLHHYFRRDLRYLGFGGKGKQVRDLLHVEDLASLIELQLEHLVEHDGKTFNIGGGPDATLSLAEATALCREITGNTVRVSSDPQDRLNDVRLYVSDNREVTRDSGWAPKTTPRMILSDIFHWVRANEDRLRDVLLSS